MTRRGREYFEHFFDKRGIVALGNNSNSKNGHIYPSATLAQRAAPCMMLPSRRRRPIQTVRQKKDHVMTHAAEQSTARRR